MTVPAIALHEIKCWFETSTAMVRAVNGISLELMPGQAMGIVGESGSGKTQTFSSVFGLSRGWPGIVGGSARVGSVDVLEGLSDHVSVIDGNDGARAVVRKNEQRWNAIHHRRLAPVLGHDVAMMFQDARRSLIPYWTVRQHLAHILRRQGHDDIEHRAAGLLARFGFRHTSRILAALPAALSGGEAQRVMLAIVMAMSPTVLIADEPTTALDAISQVRVLTELERIHGETDVAIVVISHDLAVVGRVVEMITVVFGGRVVERAPAAILSSGRADVLHPYSAALRESQRRRGLGLPILGAPRDDWAMPRAVGCPYVDRCMLKPKLRVDQQSRCENEFPAETFVAENHTIACWGLAS